MYVNIYIHEPRGAQQTMRQSCCMSIRARHTFRARTRERRIRIEPLCMCVCWCMCLRMCVGEWGRGGGGGKGWERKSPMFKLYFKDIDITAVGTSDISIRSFRSTLNWDPKILWGPEIARCMCIIFIFFAVRVIADTRGQRSWVLARVECYFLVPPALESHTVSSRHAAVCVLNYKCVYTPYQSMCI